jgi:hypothetical protein
MLEFNAPRTGLVLPALLLCQQLLTAAGFPIQLTGRVDHPRPNSTVQVLLERDNSRRWQQYLDGTGVVVDGGFQIAIQRPGVYWLIASEETNWSYRRGACLVEVKEGGEYALKSVPDTAVGRKWGGSQATSSCGRGVVPLTVYRSKPAHPKPK